MYYDWTFIILIPAILITLYAQWKVHRAFKITSQIPASANLTGREVAEAILRAEGIKDVSIQKGKGFFSDYYHPIKKVLNLSDEVYDKKTIAALGVAAHETGHAVQHSKKYGFLMVRSAIYPVTRFGSGLAPVLFLLGIFMSYSPLINIGIGLFAISVIFTIITLPVEFNASRRAVILIQKIGLVRQDEIFEVKRVLNAAALTYVAAALMAMLQFLRLIIIAQRR